jgi:tRNA uridine 5-carbamoylmethylation protein Kti12
LKKLKDASEHVLILSGVGGVGKTALIKKLYEQLNEKIPFYIFKATEFELTNINDLFTYLNFQDFVDAHKEDNHKIIVIDSAEKLLDLKNTDPFKEFLSSLIQSKWKLIFTTEIII